MRIRQRPFRCSTATAVLLACLSSDLLLREAAGAEASRSSLLVVGSLNVDITVTVDRLPLRHETMIARSPFASVAVGGKGANQAVAAARLRRSSSAMRVQFVTNFGGDAHASMLQQTLEDNGVDVGGSSRSREHPSGQGYVFLEKDGSVSSIVAGGANAAWTVEQVSASLDQHLADAAVLMLQREVPEAINVMYAEAAQSRGIPVILDAGGEDTPVGDRLLASVDFLCPNEGELSRLTGLSTEDKAQVIAAAKSLQARGARNVLVTLGERGSLLLQHDGTVLHQDPLLVPGGLVVDATGAGDSFRAAFAVALTEGLKLEEGLALASAAGAIAVSSAGAVPSLPWRSEAYSLLAGEEFVHSATVPETNPTPIFDKSNDNVPQTELLCKWSTDEADCGRGDKLADRMLGFASRLNSMKARSDLWNKDGAGHGGVPELIARQGQAEGLDTVFFNFPQHLAGEDPALIRNALKLAGLQAGAICMRFPAESMGLGAFTNPSKQIRDKALKLTMEACRWATELNATELIVWPQTDGYDYHLQINYFEAWDRAVEAYRAVCDACPDLRVSIEYKPTDESTRFSVVPSTAAAIILAEQVARPNFGLTLDVGHMIMAGENPAQSVAMVARAGRLFGMQFGDGHSRLGAEDGLMFGSVHQSMALELLVWLRKVRYNGYIYFDTFPRNEDPVRELEYNIRRFQSIWKQAGALVGHQRVDTLLTSHDSMGMLELLEEI